MLAKAIRFVCYSTLLLVASLAISGCKKPPVQSNEILIGEYGSLTGSTAVFGQGTHKGIMLAVDEVNAAGGLLGKPVRVITEDDEGNQDEAVSVVKKLIDLDGVIGVLGEVASTRSLAGGGVCEDEHVPMISPSSTNPDVTKDRKYVFRVCFTDDFQGSVGAQFAVKQGWKKVAVLSSANSDYSKKLSYFFTQTFSQSGQIAAAETYNDGDTDFAPQLTGIRAAAPDAVYLPGYYTEIDLILKQARDLGITCPFFGGDGWDGVTLDKTSEGCYFTNHYSPEDPRPSVQTFIKSYEAKYNGEVPDAFGITGYDAANVMFDAIKRANSTDREAITAAIASTTNFPGAGGSITIDANHNAKKPICILEITGGKTHLADTIQPQ
ncbi:MAG: ABC transporter substrate-binding protein [Tepidisphaeraceae bacterium]|jgi:branched-chain amino acid transport system substrate-binding protein